MKISSHFSLFLGLFLFVLSSSTFAQALLAFPGAEGFGAYAKGGRGGMVLHVNNLNNDGPGSLRWAIESEGPRTIVFDVSGTIELTERLDIENPYLTIAGQTAPGSGICLKGETLRIATHDVIVHYLRVRLGDGTHGQGSLQGKDAISISKGRDIIVDHCSASWSLDEVLSASTREPSLSHVTVQWCFITEGLNPDKHGFGSLIRGTGGAKYSFLYNLYAHQRARSPRPGNYDSNPHTEDSDGLLLDFRNNVIYNWAGGYAGYNQDKLSVTRLNYVGNYLIPGNNSENNGIAYATGSHFNQSFFDGNYYDEKKVEDQWGLVRFRDDWTDEELRSYKRSSAFQTGPISNKDGFSAFTEILESGGAILPKRDAVDGRIVEDVKNRSGKIIISQQEVGGWPKLESAPAPLDTDRDGMPDEWEEKQGLNPLDVADGNHKNEEGYTMLESYLNGIGADKSLPAIQSGVYKWDKPQVERKGLREKRTFFEGSSPHFEYLKIHASTQYPGAKASQAHANNDFEECIIVKEGTMKITIEGESKFLSAGGVILLMPRDMHSIENVGKDKLTYYVMKYRARKKMNLSRGVKAGASMMLHPDSLTFRKSSRGGGRPYFDRPTAMCERFEMHVTQLNNMGPSHNPHAHAETEIILVISGETDMMIDEQKYSARAGDFYFIESQAQHGVSNSRNKPCTYFAFKWK